MHGIDTLSDYPGVQAKKSTVSLRVRQSGDILLDRRLWVNSTNHWDADDRQSCYHVIEALLGKSTAQRLQQHHVFAAQRVRSTHLHTGEFHGSELVRVVFMSSYEDPSFGEALREMARVTPAAIIEWLRRRGDFDMPAVRRRKTMQRRIKGECPRRDPSNVWYRRGVWVDGVQGFMMVVRVNRGSTGVGSSTAAAPSGKVHTFVLLSPEGRASQQHTQCGLSRRADGYGLGTSRESRQCR